MATLVVFTMASGRVSIYLKAKPIWRFVRYWRFGLARMLHKWTTFFRGSKLYRDKWDTKRGERTYGQITIEDLNKIYDKIKETKHALTSKEELWILLNTRAKELGAKI